MSTTTNLDSTFAALGHQTRRAILERLVDGDVGLAELADPFDMSQTAVSKHVRVLRDAGLVDIEKRGRTRYCRLNAARLESASNWLAGYESFWATQIENLEGHFAGEGER